MRSDRLFTVSVSGTVSGEQCCDNNGNLTNRQAKGMSGEVINYIYNSENQLVEVKWYVGADLQKEAKYTYGALGKRISKEIIDHQDGSKSFSRGYIYSGNEILYEFNGEQELLATYTHSTMRTDDVLSIDVTSEGVNAGKAPSARSYFYLKDGLGSVVDVVDSSGSKVQHHVYSAFGKLLKVEDGNGNDVTDAPVLDPYFTYTGRELDKETGLYYYRARYYDSSVGRFISVDPHPGKISSPLSVTNRYAYANNSPTNFVDPSGRIAFLAAVLIGAAIGGIAGEFMNDNSFFQNMLIGASVGAATFGVASLIGGVSGAMSGTISTEAAATTGLNSAAGGYVGALNGFGLGLLFPSSASFVAAGVMALPVMYDMLDGNGKLNWYSKFFMGAGAVGNFAVAGAQIATNAGFNYTYSSEPTSFTVFGIEVPVPAIEETFNIHMNHSAYSIMGSIGGGGLSIAPLL